MHRIRGKLSYSNVISTLCLVLLLGGGTAYAAAEMLPKASVGTKQIQKESVTPSKLSKSSKAALTGPTGAQGATGPQGPQGPKGDKGDRGEPGPLLSVLPSGRTEYGTIGAEAQVSGVEVAANAQLPIPAPVALTDENILVAPHAGCTGTYQAPTAPPGDVCIYLYYKEGASSGPNGYVWGEGTSKYGFQMSFNSSETRGAAFGNWAYTAP